MQVNKDRLVKTLQSLVRIPSFQDSLKVSKWVKDEMEGIGFNVRSDKDGNLIAETGKGQGFLLNAHLDTVGLGEGWKHDPLGGIVEDGKVYGRGASDCKAGVAAMLEIARIIAKERVKKRVVFTFTAYEEGYPIERNGVHTILPGLKNIEKGLILEPTTEGNEIGIAVGCRGTGRYNIEIIGKRGHSSRPDLYDNPIYKFPGLLSEIEKVPKREMRIPLLGETISDTVTITEIWAKEGHNVIPGKCEVGIDRRSLPDEKPEHFRDLLEKACRKSLGEKFNLLKRSAIQGYYFDDRAFLELCKSAILSKGFKPRPYFKLARTDACILYNFAGIGAFMIGPGSIKQGHVIDENCDIKGMLNATEAVLGVIRRWDGS